MASRQQVRDSRILQNKTSRFGFINSFFGVSIVAVLTVILCTDSVYCYDVSNYCEGKFSRCLCKEDFVECHDEKLPNITVLYHYIKDHVVNVTITGSNFTELPQNVLGSCHDDSSLRLDELKRLDLSNNHIQYVHGKTFHCMPHLEELDLSENDWKNDLKEHQKRYFTSLPELKHLDLTNAFDEVWNGSIHMTKLASIFSETDMSKLETLKLGNNEFFSFSIEAANKMCALTSLKTLDLSHNNLESPSLPTKQDCLEKLTTLDLSYNKMKRLPQEFIDKVSNLRDLKKVKLRENLFNCDCGLIDTWYWLNSSRIVEDKFDILCEDGYHSSYIKKSVLSIMPAELMCQGIEAPSNVATKVVIGLIFGIIGGTLVAFLIVNRGKVKLVYKRWSKRMPKVNFRSRTGYKSVQEVACVENV